MGFSFRYFPSLRAKQSNPAFSRLWIASLALAMTRF
jgi:hypothetical protein